MICLSQVKELLQSSSAVEEVLVNIIVCLNCNIMSCKGYVLQFVESHEIGVSGSRCSAGITCV